MHRHGTVLVLALCLLGAVAASGQNTNEPRPCPMDAKLCPDGSYVGRTGPNCEFAPCPGATPSPQPSPSGEPRVVPPRPPEAPAAPAAPAAPVAPVPPQRP